MKSIIGSLRGASVRPLDPSQFHGTVWIPKDFRKPGQSNNEVVLRYLDHLDAGEDILKGNNAKTVSDQDA